MLYGLIVACEISFWLVLLAGFSARYILKKPKLSTVLLLAAPCIDLALLTVSILDLRTGTLPTTGHALAAVYIGVSVGWGSQIVAWTDAHFAHKYLGTAKPQTPKYGKAHARYERTQWLRHLLAWAVGSSLLLLATLLVTEGQRQLFLNFAALWSVVLVIDFLISFSYSLFPRTEKKS